MFELYAFQKKIEVFSRTFFFPRRTGLIRCAFQRVPDRLLAKVKVDG